MTLWNLIRDFFVEHIFGGITSENIYYSNFIGYGANDDALYDNLTSTNYMVSIGKGFDNDFDYSINYLNIGDWLSTTFTIITLVLLVIFLYIFVKWIFKLFSGLLK